MKIQQQLIKHDPENGAYGDCCRTCFAIILDMDAAEVPHFMDRCPDNAPAPDAMKMAQAWLAQHRLASFCVPYVGDIGVSGMLEQLKFCSPNVPSILTGQSRLGVNHCVVVLNGEIVCDPSGNGIVGPADDGMFWVEVLAVGKVWAV